MSTKSKTTSDRKTTALCAMGVLVLCTVHGVHDVWVAWFLLAVGVAVHIKVNQVREHLAARKIAHRRHLVKKYSARYAR